MDQIGGQKEKNDVKRDAGEIWIFYMRISALKDFMAKPSFVEKAVAPPPFLSKVYPIDLGLWIY